ncbi:Recombinase zinc beta ribbon domain-containing protein [Hespellia stercorisuis DSM 15480]|uniref:Recombinase zinc beta ribbon domain-containing protein n=1 Tax=Hespellia stercorisuis DSM 15480 TaxID=1121950 RepID=A0A1M6SGJ1_9FIRM|nr:Recombinase zinc beta ribbon domain-containing protein [Hespellia stercorisuis DSM 15480]
MSHETFVTAAAMIAQRAKEKGIAKDDEKYQKRYALSGKIICGECGATFRRRIHSSTHQKYPAWCCNPHLSDTNKCSMLYVKESTIELAFITMMNKLLFERKLILKPLLEALRTTSKDSNLLKIKELENQLLKNTEQRKTLMRLMAQSYLYPALFNKEKNELMMQADGYRTEIEVLNHMVTGDIAIAAELIKLLHFKDEIRMGHPPYGYKIENRQAMPDEVTSAHVQKFLKNYLSDLSLTTAAKEAGFSMKPIVEHHEEPFMQAEYIYSLIECELMDNGS